MVHERKELKVTVGEVYQKEITKGRLIRLDHVEGCANLVIESSLSEAQCRTIGYSLSFFFKC